MSENQYVKNIRKRYKVEILTGRYKIVKGFVEDIASRKQYQPGGVVVRLKSGEIGKVQKILSKEIEENLEIKKMLEKGENHHAEFKAEALWSLGKTEQEIRDSKSIELRTFRHKASKAIIARSLAAFLNSDGGNLVIGVKEKKNEKGEFEVIGIQGEINKLKDATKDGYKRMIIDEVIRAYFSSRIYNNINEHFKISFQEFDGKLLCMIKVNKSDKKVFLNLADKEVFMIRAETESRALQGEALVDYCLERFS